MTVTATGDTDLYGPGDEADLFDMSRKMAGKLKRLAEENGVAVGQDIRLADRPLKRFSLRPELDHLERTMFRYPYRPWGGPAEGIRLVQAENPADEVDFVVNQIHRLVKKDGFRYREIAIVAGICRGMKRRSCTSLRRTGSPCSWTAKRTCPGIPL